MESVYNVFTESTVKKAQGLLRKERMVQKDVQDDSIWWVKGSGGSKYRVQSLRDEHGEHLAFSCTCPNGLNRGGAPSCYHTAAVHIILEEGRQDEFPVMEDPSPVNEDFTGGASIQSLRDQGFTDEEIEFLSS